MRDQKKKPIPNESANRGSGGKGDCEFHTKKFTQNPTGSSEHEKEGAGRRKGRGLEREVQSARWKGKKLRGEQCGSASWLPLY